MYKQEFQSLLELGDGSALETGANCDGKPTCDCRSKGIYKCKCDRIYSDQTAKTRSMPRQLFLLEYYCEKCCGNVPSCLNPQHATSIIPTIAVFC